jgi:hypothetical protein
MEFKIEGERMGKCVEKCERQKKGECKKGTRKGEKK